MEINLGNLEYGRLGYRLDLPVPGRPSPRESTLGENYLRSIAFNMCQDPLFWERTCIRADGVNYLNVEAGIYTDGLANWEKLHEVLRLQQLLWKDNIIRKNTQGADIGSLKGDPT